MMLSFYLKPLRVSNAAVTDPPFLHGEMHHLRHHLHTSIPPFLFCHFFFFLLVVFGIVITPWYNWRQFWSLVVGPISLYVWKKGKEEMSPNRGAFLNMLKRWLTYKKIYKISFRLLMRRVEANLTIEDLLWSSAWFLCSSKPFCCEVQEIVNYLTMLYFDKAFDLVREMVMIYLKSLKTSILLILNQVRKSLKTIQYFQLTGIRIK